MPFRVSFRFGQQSTKAGGWSENFWINSNDLTFVTNKANEMWTVLWNSKAAQITGQYIRISDTSTFRNVLKIRKNTGASAPTTGTDADYPNTALTFNVVAAGNYSTRQWLRGLPDSIVAQSGTYRPTPTFVGQINAVIAVLKNSSNLWSVRALDRTVLPKVVTAMDVTTGIVTCPAHGYGPAGSVARVRVKGFSSPKQANKVWRITVIDSNTFSLSLWTPLTGTPVTGNNPTARLQTYTFVQIADLTDIVVTSHKTGRPTELLSGRPRKRKT